jgi:hypothetical protein
MSKTQTNLANCLGSLALVFLMLAVLAVPPSNALAEEAAPCASNCNDLATNKCTYVAGGINPCQTNMPDCGALNGGCRGCGCNKITGMQLCLCQ